MAGTAYSKSLDNSYSTTIDGKTTTKKECYKVHIISADEAEQIFIKEMNEEDELIKTTEYFIDSPEEFVVDDNTAYVIVEELMDNYFTGPYVKRSIYSLVQETSTDSTVSHNCHFSEENGIIGLKMVEFKK